MNAAVLEVVNGIAENNKLTLRDTIARVRKAGIEFRTETNHSFTGEPKDDLVLLGYSHQGLFYPYNEEENRKLLEGIVMGTKLPEKTPVPQ